MPTLRSVASVRSLVPDTSSPPAPTAADPPVVAANRAPTPPDGPLLPDYGGACVTQVASLVQHPPPEVPAWAPAPLAGADGSTVLLTLDGLGWNQLQDRAALAPTLCGACSGGPISTVAPSTTSAALTSIATGAAPAEHGVVGYRMAVDGDVLNVLRWTTADGDARRRLPPSQFRRVEPFGGERPPVVTKAEFSTTGFTEAHLDGVRMVGYRTMATLATEIARVVRRGEPFVYAYYDGIDKVAHEYGLREHYDAELRWVDHLVAEILSSLPTGTTLAITADHGQIEVGDNLVELDPGIRPHVALQSGEGRFRWLHARPGRAAPLLEAASVHADTGWVVTRDQVIDEGWFGPTMSDAARRRLGDVALVARDPIAYVDPRDTGPYQLIGRHGSVTADEMLVPFLAVTT